MGKRQRKTGSVDAVPIVMLCDRVGPVLKPGGAEPAQAAVYIAIVPDLAKLAADRSRRFHFDAVDALVDLMIELADSEGTDGTSMPGQ